MIVEASVPDIPITLVLDNARYQKCKLVQAAATTLGIEMLYLPTYSPNLNLIERMWKFVKHRCLNSKFYPDFKIFRETISKFLDNIHEQHKDALQTLLTHKFQSFDKSEILLKAA